MTRISPCTIVGIASTLAGFLWILGAAIPVVLVIVAHSSPILFHLTSVCVFAIPGPLAVYFGLRLTRQKTKRNIKASSGAVAAAGIFGILYLVKIPIDIIPNYAGAMILILTLAVIALYVTLSRFLMGKEGLIPSRGEFIGKGIVLLITLQIYGISSQWLVFGGIDKSPVLLEPLGIRLLVACLIPCAFYVVAVRLIKRNRGKEIDPPDSGNAAVGVQN
jgi:hypothetical protein